MSEEENASLINAEEFEKITEVLIRKLPVFMEEITKAMAHEKYVQRFGISVCQFYHSLKQEGMGNEEALELTKEFINTFNIGAIVKGMEKIEDIKKVLGFFAKGKETL